jgi:uncharacterized protein (TIGR02145 family)
MEMSYSINLKYYKMKNKRNIWTCSFLAFGLLFILSISCKKENNGLTYGSMTDQDGNTYKTIQIGTQIWMAENLKTTKFNDGTSISNVTDSIGWSNLSTPAYCWYNNDASAYKNTYGALYNWYAVNSGKLSPKGWHIPTDDEWTILVNYLGGDYVAGEKMKESGTTHWQASEPGFKDYSGSNSSGFTGLPGGNRGLYDVGKFGAIRGGGGWWSSTEYDSTWAWTRSLHYADFMVPRYKELKTFGFSVRCIKN